MRERHKRRVWLQVYKHIDDVMRGQFNGPWNTRASPLGKDEKYGARSYEHTSKSKRERERVSESTRTERGQRQHNECRVYTKRDRLRDI